MPEPRSRSGYASSALDLDARLAGFLAALAKDGYSKNTRDGKRRAIAPFLDWARMKLKSVADFEPCVRSFMARPSRRRWKAKTVRAALPQFAAYLESLGVVPPLHSALSPAEQFVRRYVEYLRDSQGLCRRSIEVYCPFVRGFVVAQRLPERMRADPIRAC
jgi:hypothetical protein